MWETPDDYQEINYTLLMVMIKGTELWAAMKMQQCWRAKVARGDFRAARGARHLPGATRQ